MRLPTTHPRNFFEYDGEEQLVHKKVAHVYGLVMIEGVRKSLTVRSDGILSLIMT